MISHPESERPEQWNEYFAELEADLKIDALIDLAATGDSKAIAAVIEPIGNNDEVTKAFVELIALARVDEYESPASCHYSAKIAHVRNDCRIKAFKKLTELTDKYYQEVFENEGDENE